MLYEAAQSMLRSKKWSWLKAWAMQIARRRGMGPSEADRLLAQDGRRWRRANADDDGYSS